MSNIILLIALSFMLIAVICVVIDGVSPCDSKTEYIASKVAIITFWCGIITACIAFALGFMGF